MTPDHLHGVISIAAMKRGKHVIMHKPIANRLKEAQPGDRDRAQNRRRHALHALGCQRLHGAGDGVDQGRRHRHAARSAQLDQPSGVAAVPDTPHRHAAGPRRLRLGPLAGSRTRAAPIIPTTPTWCSAAGTISAAAPWPTWGTTACGPCSTPWNSIRPHQRRADAHPQLRAEGWRRLPPVKNDFSFPTASVVRFQYPARGTRPAVDLIWYEGGMRPPTPPELDEDHKELPAEGMMFVGDKGKILAGFRVEEPAPDSGAPHERLSDAAAPPARASATSRRSFPRPARSGSRLREGQARNRRAASSTPVRFPKP